MPSYARAALVAFAMTGGLSLGCADEDDFLLRSADGGPGGGGAGGSGGSMPSECVTGEILGPDGTCMTVGIQGCAELFIDEHDGLCRPEMDKCPAGTIPKFDQGCVPVGIRGCPELFMEEDGLCHPTMAKCPAGTFAAPLLGCVPIDGTDGCGSGTWGHIEDGPDTVWVDPAYAGGDGDGTKEHPLATIDAALALVPHGGRIALAAGIYDEPVQITKPLEILGRCPSLVTITGAQPTYYGDPYLGQTQDAIVLVEATDGVAIGQLSISGPGYGVIAVSATVALTGLHIHDVTNAGIHCRDGADVSIDRCLVERVLPDPIDSKGGPGLNVYDPAHATVTDSAFFQVGQMAVRAAYPGSTITATGMLVEGTDCDPAAGYCWGHGILATGGAIHATSTALVGNALWGAEAFSLGSEVWLIDSLVEGTRENALGQISMAVGADTGAQARLAGSAIVNNACGGVIFDEAAGEARGNLIRGNDFGIANHLQSAAALVDNAAVRNRDFGIQLYDPSAGAVVEANLAEANGCLDIGIGSGDADGIGVHAAEGVVVRNNAVIDTVGNGLSFNETSGLAEHNLAAGTTWSDRCTWRGGDGVRVGGEQVIVDLVGNAILDNENHGLWAHDPVEVAIRRSLIADTRPRTDDGELGCGVAIEGATATVDRVILVRNHLAGLFVHSSAVTLTASRIEATREGSFTGFLCPLPPCPWNKATMHHGIADGLIAAAASVQVLDLSITGCSRAGALFHGSEGSLREVVSSDNGFGLVLQGSPRPVVADDCTFTPNHEQDVLADSELAIPNSSSELPETR